MENLAARSNGHLLLTASNQPYLYDINPSASSITPTILPQFSNVGSVLGIAETSPDVFAVAAGNYSASRVPTFGSFAVWSVNMNTAEPTVKLITTIPEAKGLNGAAALNGFTGTVLIADSILGAIWKVDVNTGAYSMAIQNSDLNPDPSVAEGQSLGINGLRMADDSVYFTNSYQGTYGRIPINSDGSASGDAEILARTLSSSDLYDDFDLNSAGTAYISIHPNAINEVTTAGVSTNMTGDGSSFLQPTSARFGRGSEVNTLYVGNYGNGEVFGQVVAVTNLS